jgi:hypothetical protein
VTETDVKQSARALVTALAPQPSVSQVSITLAGFSSTTITVAYVTLPANNPKSNGNFVAVWESTILPWPQPPLATAAVTGTGQQGAVVLTGLSVQQKAYIVGYAVGPNISDICATATLFVGGQQGNTFSASIGLSAITSDTLVVHYQMPSGYQPATNNNWVGLWPGTVSPYYTPPPQAVQPVTSYSDEGDVAMSNLGLTISTPYTLIYFMGKTQNEAAAIVNFTTAP